MSIFPGDCLSCPVCSIKIIHGIRDIYVTSMNKEMKEEQVKDRICKYSSNNSCYIKSKIKDLS
jgi:hypothetical protein